MQSKLKTLCLAVAAACVSSSALAVNYSLGNLSLLGSASNTHSFATSFTGSFTDVYTFSINNPGTVSGFTKETDGSLAGILSISTLDLALSSAVLSQVNSNGSLTTLVSDNSPSSFTFSGLAGGNYSLLIAGSVTKKSSLGLLSGSNSPSYTLTASVSSTAPIASPTPEASDLAMTVLGLAGVGFWARRQKKA
jgi:hypothetical protein